MVTYVMIGFAGGLVGRYAYRLFDTWRFARRVAKSNASTNGA